MIDGRLVHGLSLVHGFRRGHDLAASTDLTAEEILDVLWLAARYPAGQTEPAAPSGDAAEDSGEDDSPRDELDEAKRTTDPEGLPLYNASPPEDSGDAVPATTVGFDAPSPLRDVVTLPMAVRRLRRVRAPGPSLAIDVDATVEATAEARIRMPMLTPRPLIPRFTRAPQPVLDLALVVDDSPSMRIWCDSFDHLERLLAQTGAFRSVSRWRLSPAEGAIRPQTPLHNRDRSSQVPPQRPQQLVDPSGRRLVLVATDARDRAWYGKAAWDALSVWCAAMPTVLVQMLPPQYWSDTAVGVPYMTSRALTPAAPNGQYAKRFSQWADEPGGLPLPVVTLTEKSLDAWAKSVVNGTAWATGITATAPESGTAPPAAQADPVTAVNTFLSRATPGARRLASILASADTPLSMPLISVLRERLAPETTIAELAEIMACNLLEEVWPTADAAEPLLRYRTGAREILYQGIGAFEEWDAFAAVGRYLEERRAVGGPVQVFVSDPAGSAERDAGDKPFYDFHHALAVRLGLRSPVTNPDAVPVLPEAPVDQPPVASSERQPIAAEALPSGDSTGDTEALFAALETELASLDDSQQLVIAAFELDGLTVWQVQRDEIGTPQAQSTVLATGPVANPMAFYQQRLIPSLGDRQPLIVYRSPNESLAAVLRLVRADSGAKTFGTDEIFEQVLRKAISNVPLTHGYDLVLLSNERAGHLRVSTQPLFQPGARSGDRSEPFQVECAAADQDGTVFAVVAHERGQEPLLGDTLRRVQVQSAVMPTGVYRISALLDRPGQVQFDGLPRILSADSRPLGDLIRRVPERLHAPEPVHLVCLVEVGEDWTRLRRGINRLEQLVALAGTSGRAVAVSVISYGSHAVTRDMYEEPVVVRIWAAKPGPALHALRRLLDREGQGPADQGYARAAQTECALDELSSRLHARAGRPIVVTVGGRPPHPPRVDLRSEIIPCPRRVDWRTALGQLREVPGIRFGALCEPNARGLIWRELGRDAIESTESADMQDFAGKLGLRVAPQAVSFPLAIPAVAGVAQGTQRASHRAAAGTAILGPVGSGTTTFLAALNMALTQSPNGAGLRGSNVPSGKALSEITDLLAARREFPPPTPGTDWFEWTLLQQLPESASGVSSGDPSALPPAPIPLRVMQPAGELLHPSVGSGPERQTLIRDLAQVQGIIYMFDPIREIAVGDAFETASNLLRQLRQEVSSIAPIEFDGKLEHYVAVCLTKFDEPEILGKALSDGFVSVDRKDPHGFPRVPDSRAREFLAGLDTISGDRNVQSLLDTFDEFFHRDRVKYFVTSAIGFYADPRTGKYNPADAMNVIRPATGAGRSTIRGPIHSINVVEPLLWLAAQITAVGAPGTRRRRR